MSRLSLRRMRLVFVAVALLASRSPAPLHAQREGVSAPAAATPAPSMRARLDAIVDSAAARGFSGTILIAPLAPRTGDAITYERSIGLADAGSKRAIAPSDRWRWASVTKQVTAVLVMQDVEKGRIALDSTIARYLPDFRGNTARRVTVRDLLRHTSGLPDPESTPPNADGIPEFYLRTGARAGDTPSALGFCAGPADSAAIGTRFAYDNCDYLVLGAILERVNGKPFAALVQERLTTPLALRSLTLATERTVARDADSPIVGYVAAGKREPAINAATYGAGGALYGTPRDLLTFDRALASARLLSDSARATLWQGEPRFGFAALGAWSFPAPLAGCAADIPLVERRGDILGVQVRNVIAPQSNVALIIFTNRGDFEFGEVWQRTGLTHDLLAAAICR